MIDGGMFLLGLAFGSFLNVCVHRLPRHESIVTPRSHCPGCGKPIAAWDNIPLLSYLLLRGRCRRCGASISPIYPLVELLTGLLFWWTYHRFGFSPEFIKNCLFGMLLLILIFTDLRERLIPHSVTVFGILVGTTLSWLVPVEHGVSTDTSFSWCIGPRLCRARGAWPRGEDPSPATPTIPPSEGGLSGGRTRRLEVPGFRA